MKAGRNKTIDFGLEEGREYLARCLRVETAVSLDAVRNRTIAGDLFEVQPLLPPALADLMIVDPPYNIDKDFHGHSFHRSSDEAYADFTE